LNKATSIIIHGAVTKQKWLNGARYSRGS